MRPKLVDARAPGSGYLEEVDAITPQPGELGLPLAAADGGEPGYRLAILDELWQDAGADAFGLSKGEFEQALLRSSGKYNYGFAAEIQPTPAQQESFLRGLKLADLALAHACALGREAAWQRFLALYRGPLQQAAVAITRSSSLGQDLADSLYSELFGLTEREGVRKSPLASYSGRGSLMGWLRTTLAQRHIDHHRRTHRETPIDDHDFAAAPAAATAEPAALGRLGDSLAVTLRALQVDDRFLLSAYYLDQRTLLQIAQVLRVHEATVSRKLKRLTQSLQQQLLKNLQRSGLSKGAAQEALGADPRDLSINLRSLLQSSTSSAFHNKGEETVPGSR